MKANWFAINRSIVENRLFIKKPLWGWAWIHILTRTNYKTEEVCLTEVYRDLADQFTYSQWRHMVSVLVKEEMLELGEAVNLGDRAGHRQTARVLNWSKYQKTAQSEQQSERRANDSASAERNHDGDIEIGMSAQSERRANDSASAERVAVSIKNIQQDKEEKEEAGADSYISAEEEAFAQMQGKPNPKVEELKNQTHLRRLIGGENFKHPQVRESWRSWYLSLSPDEIEEIWKASRKQDETTPLFWFVDVCNGRRAKPKLEGLEGGSAPPKIRFGDVVSHPVEGEFVADFQALYQDAWRCPEGHFIPAAELQVVRSTDA